MKTLGKLVLVLVAIVVVVVIAAIIIVPLVFDPNDYKDEIASAVKKQTGRELSIQGELGVSVFPWVGLDVGTAELGNASGFDDVFARFDKAAVRVKLLPLLSKRIEMDTVTLQGFTLNLARNKEGASNWDDLAKAAEEPAQEPATPQPETGESAIAALTVGGLDVRDAKLNWNDEQSGQRYSIEGLQLRTGNLAPGEPVDFSLEFDVAGGDPAVTGHIAAKSTLTMDPEAQTYALAGLELSSDLAGATLPGEKLTLGLAADVRANVSAQTLNVDDLTLNAVGLEAAGNLAATRIIDQPQFQGSLTLSEFNPRELLERLQQSVDTADAGVLTSANLSASFSGTTEQISFKPLALALDQTTLEGTVAIVDFAAPALRFDLAGNAIDLDRYLPAPSEEADPAPATTPGRAASASDELPLEPLRALDLDGQFALGKLKVAKLNVSDIAVTLKAKNGLISLSPLQANLYEGSYAGNIALDVRGTDPRISLDETLDGVQFGPLLQDLQGTDKLSGQAELRLKLTGTGAGPDALKKTLNGTTAFAFTNGTVKGINLARLIREAKARLEGRSLPPETAPPQTDFSELTGSVQIRDGLASNQDLFAKSPLLRIEGKGTANLPTEALDYLLTTTLVRTLEGQGGKELKDLEGIPIPIRLTGTFTEPAYQVDLSAVLKGKADAEIERQRRKLEKKLDKKLKGLFN
jgi:AsmA protein